MGAAKGAAKPDTTGFKKKGTGQPVLVSKHDISKAPVHAGSKKQAIPRRDEKPIHGLVSDKNFIVANAVENILAAPKLPPTKDKDMLKKKTYG